MAYKYNKALFNEQLWAELIASQNVAYVKEEDLITLNPESDYMIPNDDLSIPIIEEDPKKSNIVSFSEIVNHSVDEPVQNHQDSKDVVDFNSYFEPVNSLDNDQNIADLDAQTTNFADIRAELEKQIEELEKYKLENSNGEINFENNTISLDEIEPEVFETRGRAA